MKKLGEDPFSRSIPELNVRTPLFTAKYLYTNKFKGSKNFLHVQQRHNDSPNANRLLDIS